MKPIEDQGRRDRGHQTVGKEVSKKDAQAPRVNPMGPFHHFHQAKPNFGKTRPRMSPEHWGIEDQLNREKQERPVDDQREHENHGARMNDAGVAHERPNEDADRDEEIDETIERNIPQRQEEERGHRT